MRGPEKTECDHTPTGGTFHYHGQGPGATRGCRVCGYTEVCYAAGLPYYIQWKPSMNRGSPWIQTFRGRFWPLAPASQDVDIHDIAHALSLRCRFTGHCLRFYSVAEHSVYISRWIETLPVEQGDLSAPRKPVLALWGLLHDAAEAYLPDVARPIKDYLTGFRAIENGVLKAIAARFGLPWPMPPEIKTADMAMLATEKHQAMPPSPEDEGWFLPIDPLDIQIEFWEPEKAEHEFLRRFHELYEGAGPDPDYHGGN